MRPVFLKSLFVKQKKDAQMDILDFCQTASRSLHLTSCCLIDCRGTRIRTWDFPAQAGRATGLRHTPKKKAGSLKAAFRAEEAGFEPAVQLPVRQFSKLVVSATHPLLQKAGESSPAFFFSNY